MDTFDNVDVETDDHVVTITIDSETPKNSLNDAMREELLYLATTIGNDDDLRCVVLRGSDGIFSAGGNIPSFDDSSEAPPKIRRSASFAHDVVVQMKQAETPVVTGIDGPAVGAGFSLAMLGDLKVMHEDAFLQYGFPGVGLTGDGSITFSLPRLVGLEKAKQIALLNERISAAEAAEIGLVTEVASADEFDDRLSELAHRIADGPTKALGRIVRLFEESYARQLPTQLAHEVDQIATTAETSDYLEGIRAFTDGRDPQFTGR